MTTNLVESGGTSFGTLEEIGSSAAMGAVPGLPARGATKPKPKPNAQPKAKTQPVEAEAPGTFCTRRDCGGPKKCFVAGTLVQTASGPVPIEDLRVGHRVTTITGGTSTVVVDDTWSVVELEMPNPQAPDDFLHVVLLRPVEWLEWNQVAVGTYVFLELEELSSIGWGTVRSIRGPPEVQAGSGRLVMATVSLLNSEVLKLRRVLHRVHRGAGRRSSGLQHRGRAWMRQLFAGEVPAARSE